MIFAVLGIDFSMEKPSKIHPTMASKMTCLENHPETRPRWPKTLPRCPRDAPKTPPRCPKISQNRPQEPPQRRLEGVLEASGRSLVTKKRPRAAQNHRDLDFGASGPGFWKFFSRMLARFLVDLIHMFYHCSKFLEVRFCMKLSFEL